MRFHFFYSFRIHDVCWIKNANHVSLFLLSFSSPLPHFLITGSALLVLSGCCFFLLSIFYICCFLFHFCFFFLSQESYLIKCLLLVWFDHCLMAVVFKTIILIRSHQQLQSVKLDLELRSLILIRIVESRTKAPTHSDIEMIVFNVFFFIFIQ